FVLVGVAAGQAGNAVWLSFLFAAVGAGLTGVSYARLVRLRPKNAPEFQFVSMAFGEGWGFLAGWLVLAAGVISAAAVALGFAGYLSHLTGAPVLGGALGLLVISLLVASLGIGESVGLAASLTVPTVIGLVLIIVIGVPHLGSVDILEMPFGMAGVMSAASLVFFAFLGFEGMANLAEEMKNPERDLFRAILLAIGISTLCYILVAVAAVNVVGWADLSRASAPLAVVAGRAFGANADLFVSLVSLAATASTALLLLLAASRAMWAMSCAGVLPMTFCVVGKTRRTPWRTIFLAGIFAIMFVSIGNIEYVAEFTNFSVLLAFAGVNASVIKLFPRAAGDSRLRHIGLNRFLPGAGILVSLWLAVNTGWQAAVMGGSVLAAGVVVRLMITASRKTR
ncbi:MAG: amino acid permease, partial [Chloroflexi bacterium]|nr:amino acid permease [Chloroflexota bacterium]